MTVISVRVVIEGRVQGVFFRSWTVQEATRRNLLGWIRNRLDGTVEAVFSGAEIDVNGMIRACWQGPPAAQVGNVTEYPADPPKEKAFGHMPTV